MYPRFSPDGGWIAFSSNRNGNNDVYIVNAAGGAPQSPHLSYRRRRRGRMDARFGAVSSARPAVMAHSHRRDALSGVREGGQEQSLGLDWGYSGSYSPDGKSLVFNRHPAIWSRRHYRGSYAADLWIADIHDKTYTKLLGDEQYNRFWPMWGERRTPSTSSATRCRTKRRSRPAASRFARASTTSTRFRRRADNRSRSHATPAGSSSGHRCRATARSSSTRTLSASGSSTSRQGKTNEIKLEIATRREGERGRARAVNNEVDSFDISPSGQARGDFRARPDLYHRHRARRHHARCARPDGVAEPVAEVVARRQVRRIRLAIGPAATRSGSAIRRARRRRRSPISTTRRARSCGRRTRSRCSTR